MKLKNIIFSATFLLLPLVFFTNCSQSSSATKDPGKTAAKTTVTTTTTTKTDTVINPVTYPPLE